MKDRPKFKDFDESVEHYDLSHTTGRALSPHTYTPSGNENLFRSYLNIEVREGGLKNEKHENKKLKADLRRVKEELGTTREEKEVLRSQTSIVNLDLTNKSDMLDNRIEDGQSNLNTRDTLSHHFGEVMRRYHNTLADKDRQIESLQEKLAQYENHHQPQKPPEQQTEFRAHPAVEAERLRRMNAAVQEFRRDVGLVKTQLQQSPLDDKRFPCSSSRDRVVVEELRRRQRFGVVEDLEAMANKFFQRLEFEEKLDKLHWKLESRRHMEHENSSGGECAPTCTYHKEFQMLEITRNHLLKALRDLRMASRQPKPRPQLQRDPVSITTIQTLYKAPANNVKSYGSVKDTTSELPDK